MTRGKYASTSEARRAREEAQARADRLERQLAIAHRELERVNEEANQAKLRALADMDTLRRQVTDGTSSKLEQAESLIVDLHAIIADLEAKEEKRQKAHERLVTRLIGHFVNVHKYTSIDALQLVATWGGANGYIAETVQQMRSGLSVQQVHQLDLARGYRTKQTGEDGLGGESADFIDDAERLPW